MKIIRKFGTLLLVFAITTSLLIPASAVSPDTATNTDVIELRPINVTTEQTAEGGFKIKMDLVRNESSEDGVSPRYIIVVGVASFELKPQIGTGIAYANWSIALAPGELITQVSGDFVLLKDVLGPFNPVYGSESVDVRYTVGTLYNVAYGQEILGMNEENGRQAVIFQ